MLPRKLSLPSGNIFKQKKTVPSERMTKRIRHKKRPLPPRIVLTAVFRLLFLVVPATVLFVIHQSFFLIKQVNCTIDQLPCPAYLTSHFDRYRSHSYLLINQKAALDSLKKQASVKSLTFSLSAPRVLSVEVIIDQLPLPISAYLVDSLPLLSFESTHSAYTSPVTEISSLLSDKKAQNYQLVTGGQLLPFDQVVPPSSPNLVFTDKPTPDILAKFYNHYQIVSRIITPSHSYLVESDLFLRVEGQPDIIVSMTKTSQEISSALQSLPTLVKIKTDPKIIDLRFNHPIIR